MANVNISPDFRLLFESGALFAPITEIDFEYMEILDALDDAFVEPQTLSPTLLEFEVWSDLPEPAELRFEGSGFGPLDPWALLQALEQEQATGNVDRVVLRYEGETVLQADFSTTQILVTSGNVTIEANGTYTTGLNEIADLVQTLIPFSEWGRPGFEFGGPVGLVLSLFGQFETREVILRDGDTQIGGLSLTPEATTVTLGDYRLVLEGLDIDFDALFAFFDVDDDAPFMTPILGLHDADGMLLDQGTPIFGQSTINFVPDTPGRYYLSVVAWPESTLTGQYQISSIPVGQGFDDFSFAEEDDGDAPAGPDTPYTLGFGGSFEGTIDPEGDEDWVAIDVPEAGLTYSFTAFGIGPVPIDLFDAPGLDVTRIVLLDNEDRVLAEVDEIENLRDLVDALNAELESMGLPPLPPFEIGWNDGDPHILTLDGAAYDFHAAGEFVMVRDTTGAGLELQSRMLPVGPDVTANVAAAMRLDGGNVMVTAQGGAPLWINDEAVDLADGQTLTVGHDLIGREGDTFTLYHTGDGRFVTGYSAVQVSLFDNRIDIGVALDDAWMGQVEGLMGNYDGNPATDIALADGTPLERPLRFDDLYGQFRDDWRVTDEAQSLFTYMDGESVASFYLPTFPTRMVTLDSFDAEAVAAAEAAAEAAGLVPGTLPFTNAVFDFLVTGDETWIESAVTVSEARPAEQIRPPEEIDLGGTQTDGGARDDLMPLTGTVTLQGAGAGASQVVTFRPEGTLIDLQKMTDADGRFAFELAEGDGGRLTTLRDTGAGDPSIRTGDALQALRMAVGLDPSWGPATVENFIAADFNGDGRVTTGDALQILRHAVGLSTEAAPRWVFIDADGDYSAVNRQNVDVEPGVSIAALAEGMGDVTLTGILVGNLEQVV